MSQPSSNGTHADTVVADPDPLVGAAVADLAPVGLVVADPVAAPDHDVDPTPAVAPARPGTGRSRRTNDYRLRGLDLDAPVFAEAEVRPVGRRHPIRRRRRRRLVAQWAIALAVVAVAAVGLRATTVQPYSVTTTAMVPTIQPGTDVLVLKARFLTGSISAGDIVVFHAPEGAGCTAGAGDLVKRVIARPGDTIWSEDENIIVNGVRLDEPTWHNPPFGELGSTPIERTTVPPGRYYVMGDNRTDTCDSRVFGPIAGSLVVGEVVSTVSQNGHPSVHRI